MFDAASAIFAVLIGFYALVPPVAAVIYKADCFLGNNCVQQRTQKHHHKLCFYPDANGASPMPCEDPLLRKVALQHVNPKLNFRSIAYYNLATGRHLGSAETYDVDAGGEPVVLCMSGYKQEKEYLTLCRLSYSNNDLNNSTAWNSACGMEHIEGQRVQDDECDGKTSLDPLNLALAIFAFFAVPALLFQYFEFGLKARYWFYQRREMCAEESTTPSPPTPPETPGSFPKVPMPTSPWVGALGSCAAGALRGRHPISMVPPSPDATLVAEVLPEDAAKIMVGGDATTAPYISELQQFTEEPTAIMIECTAPQPFICHCLQYQGP